MAEYFLEDFCARNGFRQKSFDPEVWEAFEEYSWPGNARELRNVVERMAILSHGDVLNNGRDSARVEAAEGDRDRDRACRKRGNRQRGSMCCGRWKNRAGMFRVRHGRLGMERTNLHKRIRALGLARGQVGFSSSRLQRYTKH